MRISILLILVTALMVSTSFIGSSKALESYQVFIIQDSIRKEVLYDAQEIHLAKKRFVIEVWLKDKLEGVSVSISYKRMYYDTPIKKRFKDWESISSKTMAEDHFNKDKALIVADENLCYWFYEPGKFHRFDPTIRVGNGTTIGTQTVENISDAETNNVYPIKEIAAPLYLVFFNYDYKIAYTYKQEDKYKVYKEYGRKRVKLSFE
jgi:hypothetical protein